MKIHLNKKTKITNLILILAIIFSTVIFFYGSKTFALDTAATQSAAHSAAQSTQNNKTISNNQSSSESIPEKNLYELTHMEKKGVKYSLFKFLIAMAGVAFSALAIFAGLKLYKNFSLKHNEKFDNIDYDKNLESPKDFKEAINIFLDKTDK